MFNFGFLLPLQLEVEIFSSSSLEKSFLWALDVECKVAPQTRYPPNQTQFTNLHPFQPQPYPSSLSTPTTVVWCTFHKTNSHNFVDCRAIKYVLALVSSPEWCIILDSLS